MLFDSRTVYLGASRDKYEQYCKALDSEKIKYKTKRVNHEEKMIAPGRGTARSMGGNYGTVSKNTPPYCVLTFVLVVAWDFSASPISPQSFSATSFRPLTASSNSI